MPGLVITFLHASAAGAACIGKGCDMVLQVDLSLHELLEEEL